MIICLENSWEVGNCARLTKINKINKFWSFVTTLNFSEKRFEFLRKQARKKNEGASIYAITIVRFSITDIKSVLDE